MILPGVYITVRDEGLISVGGIGVGTVGVVGIATEGEFNKPYIFSSYSDAESQLQEGALLKTIKLIFANGASTLYAVRAKDAESYEAALQVLENELINIVVLADQDTTATTTMSALQAHLTITTKIKRERIAIIGCGKENDTLKTIVEDTGRIICVAPALSIKTRDPKTNIETTDSLSAAYTAAAVAGLMAKMPVQTSPTNKTLTISGELAEIYNMGQLEKHVTERILAIEKREGLRVVKGITTSTNNAWSQITTRRIVDKAIYGIRAACNPYIGKLNNVRVRGAMKATIDGFLTRMVEEEALTHYELAVSATRQDEIAGTAKVDISLQPTFSIDYISVTMTLG